MIFRPLNVICALIALFAGLYLYSQKHRTALVDRDIAQLIEHSQAAHERINMLRNDWAKLNDADDLKERADKYLHLQPLSPDHYVKLSDLGDRLPPVMAPGAPPPDEAVVAQQDLAPAVVVAQNTQPMPADTQSSAPKTVVALLAHNAASANLASGGSHNKAIVQVKLDVKSKPKPPVHHPPVKPVHSNDDDASSAQPTGAPLPLAAPSAPRAHVLSAMAHTGGRQNFAQPTIISAAPHFVPVSSSLASSSASGHLPPPVPLAADDR